MAQARISAFFTFAFAIATLGMVPTTQSRVMAQDSREAINLEYVTKLQTLDKERIARLGKLAAGQSVEDAAATYREIFALAVSGNYFAAAEPIAIAAINAGKQAPDILFQARFIHVIATADRGDFDSFAKLLNTYAKASAADRRAGPGGVESETLLAMAEAAYQRLLAGGRYDLAKKLCEIGEKNPDRPEVRAHFAAKRLRLDLIGKPAPKIVAKDIDGEPVDLSKLKGQIVVLGFWATWCQPNLEELPRSIQVYDQFHEKGFSVIGINVDALNTNGPKGQALTSLVRKTMVSYGVPWTTILDGVDGQAIAKAYGVNEIPSSVVIGKDGKILAVDVNQVSVRKILAKELGIKSASN